jgi:hypothetical protein
MISLYISDDRIRLAEGAIKSKKIYIKQLVELESNVGSIETGTIKNPLELSQTIQNILNDQHIKPQKTYAVIDNSRIVFKEKEVPALSHKKLKLILLNEYASDSKQKNIAVDYIVESKFEDEASKAKKFNISVTYQSTAAITGIADAAKETGLKLEAIDIAQNATAKMFSSFFAALIPETAFLIDYKDSFMSIYIFDGGLKKYSKSSVLYSKPATDKFGDTDAFISELHSNISGVSRYYLEKNPGSTIGSLYLTGNIAAFTDEVIQRLANVTKMKASYLPCPDSVMGIDVNDFNKFSCPIGAMIRR